MRSYSCLPVKGAYKKAGDRIFTMALDKGFEMKEGRFRLHIQKKFFTVKVVRYWHSLSREATDAPSLEVLVARLEKAWAAWSNRRFCAGCTLWQGSWN